MTLAEEIAVLDNLSNGRVALIAELGSLPADAASEDLARICHAHPSLSEATRESALAVDCRTLNL